MSFFLQRNHIFQGKHGLNIHKFHMFYSCILSDAILSMIHTNFTTLFIYRAPVSLFKQCEVRYESKNWNRGIR
jgi:hypothetical protein